MSRMRFGRCGSDGVDESGAALLLALVFLTVFALLIGALTSFAAVTVNDTLSNRSQRSAVYTADAGLLGAVENLRGDSTKGVNDGTSCPTFAPASAFSNALGVSVTCTPQAGSGGAGLNTPPYAAWAVPAVGSTTEGLIDHPTKGGGCGGVDMIIQGNVASDGEVLRDCNSDSGTFNISGTIDAASCTGPKPKTVTFNKGTGSCGSWAADPTPPSDPLYLQPTTVPSVVSSVGTCLPSAVAFLPGSYSSAPSAPVACANLPFWFEPGLGGVGTYYFDFTGAEATHTWNVGGTNDIIGGTPAGWDPTVAGQTPPSSHACKQEHDVPPNHGVELIFGGDTRLSLSTTSHVELCPEPSTNQQEIALYGARTSSNPNLSSTEHATSTAGSSGFSNPDNAKDIDGSSFATANIPKGGTATLNLSAWTGLPPNAVIYSAVLEVAHQDSGLRSLSLSVTDGLGNALPAGATGITSTRASLAPPETFDLTEYLNDDQAKIGGMKAVLTATAPNNATATETVDGVVLLVAYQLPGGFRREAGCLVNLTDFVAKYPSSNLAADTGATACPLLANSPLSGHGAIFLQGTLYAPLAFVELATGVGDPVRFNRGVVARSIDFLAHPGNGTFNLAGLGLPDRYVLFRASISCMGVCGPFQSDGKLRLTSLVHFDDAELDSMGNPIPGSNVTFLSWEVER